MLAFKKISEKWNQIFLRLLTLSPYFLIAGLIDFRFHNYFWPWMDKFRVLKTSMMFDFFSIFDFYALFIIIPFFVVGVLAFRNNLPGKKWHLLYTVTILFAIGVIVSYIFFEPVPPRIHSFRWYTGLQFVLPIALANIYFWSFKEKIWLGRLIKHLLIAFGTLAAICLFEFFTNALPGTNRDFLNRMVWPYIDPFYDFYPQSANWLAYLFGPITLLAAFSIREKISQKIIPILPTISFLLCGTAFLLTKSYAGIGVFFIIIAFWLFQQVPTKYKKFLIISALILIAIGIGTQYKTEKFQILLGKKSETNSLERRAYIYKVSLNMIAEKPLTGIGPTNYQNKFKKYSKKFPEFTVSEKEMPPHPHNLILHFWNELGIFGLLGILTIYITVIKKIIIQRNNAANFYLIFAYFLGHGLIDTPYSMEEITMLFWLILALAIINEKQIDYLAKKPHNN